MFFLYFLAIFTFSSSESGSGSQIADTITMSDSHMIKVYSYLALGDSYTIGESVAESERWCVQLAKLLSSKDTLVKSPDIIAKTGWTTGELTSAIKTSGNSNTYDLVSLLIGVNNQYRGQSASTYRIEFSQLLKTSIAYAGNDPSQVFVLSIPDWGVTPYAEGRDRDQISSKIDSFNAIAKDECLKRKVMFIDITPISRKGLQTPNYIAEDKLHFSGAMYRLWAEEAIPQVKKLISTR